MLFKKNSKIDALTGFATRTGLLARSRADRTNTRMTDNGATMTTTRQQFTTHLDIIHIQGQIHLLLN